MWRYICALYSVQKGLRTGAPFIERVGQADWVTQFNTYYMRGMRRYKPGGCVTGVDGNNLCGDAVGGSKYAEHGIYKEPKWSSHHMAIASHPEFGVAMGTLTMTPSIFSPRPIAKGGVGSADSVSATVIEGCVAGEGTVRFYHGESFHPNPERRVAVYQWDFDDRDGLWWNNNAQNPDFFTPKFGEGLELETEHISHFKSWYLHRDPPRG